MSGIIEQTGTDGGADPGPRPESQPPVLVCSELVKRFGERRAVDGLSFEVRAGEAYGLLGPNGAGKTTTLRMVCGILPSDHGMATIEAGLLLGTGWLLFGLTWADWPAFLLVVAVLAAAAAALSVALSTVLPHPEMGATVAGPIAFVLAMLGGCLWPLEIVGPGLARAALMTPHAWALEALRDVGVDGDGLAHVTTDLAVLVAMTLALLAVGGLRLRRITTAAQG